VMDLSAGKRMVVTEPDQVALGYPYGSRTDPMTKVLLVEDDGETAQEIIAELTDRGFEMEWASDGLDGLAKARDLQPDAMIVDRLLPGMDGLTVIESLRKEQVRTPVLVLSALGAVDDRVRGLRMGGDDYLTKPFALVELVARIEALLRRPSETRGDHPSGRATRARSDRAHGEAWRSQDRPVAARVSPARIHDASVRPVVDAGNAARRSLELQVRSGNQPG
jgi:DNA-binding response OmpR family regulator